VENSNASAFLYRDHPTVATLRMLSAVWLTMPVALFGIVGNLVSLVVLSYHKRLNKLQTVIIQLQALAVVDTLILVTILLLRLLLLLLLYSLPKRPDAHQGRSQEFHLRAGYKF